MSYFKTFEQFIDEKLILEIGDASAKPYKFKFKSKDVIQTLYSFSTETEEYNVRFVHYGTVNKKNKGHWDVTFTVLNGGKMSEVAIVNKGQLYKVMSTVFNVIKKFVKDNKPKRLIIDPAGKKDKDIKIRGNIYKEYVKKHLKNGTMSFDKPYGTERVIIDFKK